MIDKPELTLQAGLIVNQEFFDYPAMQESAKNWLFTSKYRFNTGKFYGRHDGVQLHNLQFGHVDRHEGMMVEGFSPKDCLTIGVLQKNIGCLCINDFKMQVGDIIIVDDLKPYDFSSSHHTTMAIISISKALLCRDAPWILNSTDKIFKDKESILSNTIEKEWKSILDGSNLSNNDRFSEIEKRIIDALKSSIEGQTGGESSLTRGEKTALEVRSFLLSSLEETYSIQNIVKEFKTTDRTLENSFRSLFGITPKRFISLLKLNHAHEELQYAKNETTNVSDIATKWGFTHFGRFSKEYNALFGVFPSETLKSSTVANV